MAVLLRYQARWKKGPGKCFLVKGITEQIGYDKELVKYAMLSRAYEIST